jgi:hypothetical protein
MYVNCYPVPLGKGEVKATGRENEEGEWLETFVRANTPEVKSLSKRLGKDG